MPRGAEYDNGVPQSDNAIEAGQTKVHGVGNDNADLSRTHKVADLPVEGINANGLASGGGSSGLSGGSGKGGHNPNTLGENKGVGAQGV
ncbi:hypothetical protein P170DRAFT_506946 [Aspergillus steynii IBT 23096]|uniref:Uncharacterized protein n=1 Tax=Aspergillus steynii IBT 23096 TaxID=1392250 RepID=A0A2I2GGP4_9EURO|nr:uncharacterized protein P170DRAFT_506946 [Aspergillus steynii IBT 23096]PLB52055.1 hypothetical protein P170DRAFT_506946 [Aspergillus steynii IBT 23096]